MRCLPGLFAKKTTTPQPDDETVSEGHPDNTSATSEDMRPSRATSGESCQSTIGPYRDTFVSNAPQGNYISPSKLTAEQISMMEILVKRKRFSDIHHAQRYVGSLLGSPGRTPIVGDSALLERPEIAHIFNLAKEQIQAPPSISGAIVECDETEEDC